MRLSACIWKRLVFRTATLPVQQYKTRIELKVLKESALSCTQEDKISMLIK